MSTSKPQEIEDLPEDLPVEAVEAVEDKPKPKAKAKPGANAPRAKSDKEVKAAEEKGARATERTRREADPNGRKVPYPPTPPDVPEDLTEYAESYVKQQNKLLAGLFLFLMFYIGAVLFFALVGFWCVWSIGHL